MVNKKSGLIHPEVMVYSGSGDDALKTQIKQVFDAVVQRYGMSVAKNKLTTPNLLMALNIPANREKEVRIIIADIKKSYGGIKVSLSEVMKKGGATKIITPSNDIELKHDNWKNQILTKQRYKSDYEKDIRKLGYPKEIEIKLIQALDELDANNEDVTGIIKKWDIKKQSDEKRPKRPRRKYKKTIRKHKGGKAGENFREDYRRYLESLDSTDPDDKVNIRDKIKVKEHIEDIQEEVEKAEEDEEEAVEEGKMNWGEFKKANPKSAHKEDFEEFKKTNPNVTNYFTYLAFLYRKYTGKLISGDEGYVGSGMYAHRDTSIMNNPKIEKTPINIDGRPIPWTKRNSKINGGSINPRITQVEANAWNEHHKKQPREILKGNLSNVHKNVGGKGWWTDFLDAHPQKPEETKKEYMTRIKAIYKKSEPITEKVAEPKQETKPKRKVKTIETHTKITEEGGKCKKGGKAKKGQIPSQLKSWFAFLKEHPWDKKCDRRDYLKQMGKLYRK